MADWNPRVNELFLQAFELDDPDSRRLFLERECGGDMAILRAVQTLLKAHDEAAGFLSPSYPSDAAAALPVEGMTGNFATDGPATVDFPGKGEHVGAILGGKYKLIEEIGEGGMGSVYMAQQTEPVKRAVAIKVIKAGMDSKAVLARFEAERQALAVMDHPNIAKVLDAGTTESGRPYFVMELVKGMPITEFCDERKLSPRQRLELFVPVCQAIQHAHQKGIIHRDIKPNNVLVAMYDDRPVPKVIDFGVAKAAGQTLTDKTLMTGFGAVVGTPEYMSPEQANLNNLDIDTRSDVYSLGVLLYELLTGSTPVDRKSLDKAAILEILRIVREVEAPRPSAKLSTIDTLPSVAANRGTEPARLSRLMKGELDWVVLKALEKDRTRRYDSANGLARDIQRYLADEIVEARPPSSGYRLKKFVRRHKGQVVAASLILFTLVGGMGGTTTGLIEAKKQERLAVNAQQAEADRAEGERLAKEEAEAKRAEAEQQKFRAENGEKLAGERLVQVEAEKKKAEEEKQIAQAVRDFLQNKLLAQTDTAMQADALLKAGEASSDAKLNPTIRELLDRAAKELALDKIEEIFPNQTLIQADLLQTIGNTYRGIGEYQPALDFLKRSEALRRQHLGPDHSDTLSGMNNLAKTYLAAGKLDLAVPLFEQTLKVMKAKLGPQHPDTLACMNDLADAYHADEKLELAIPLLEETLKLRKAKLGPDNPDTLVSMGRLAFAYGSAKKLDLALPLYEETLKLRKAKLGPEHPFTLTSMNHLAVAYVAAKQLDLALPLLEETLKLRKAKLGPEHPDTLKSMNDLALAYHASGKQDLALPLIEETFKLEKFKLGSEHPLTLTTMNNLAMAYVIAKKLDLAIPLIEETLKLQKAKLGPSHPATLLTMNNLAGAYVATGKLDLALPLYEETIRLTKAKLGPEHPDTIVSMNNLARAYLNAGKLDLALPLYEETLKLQKARFGLNHPSTRRTEKDLTFLRQMLDSEQRYQRERATNGPRHLNTLLALRDVAQFKMSVGNHDAAESMLMEVLDGLADRPSDDAVRTFTVGLVGRCLTARMNTQADDWTTFNTQSMLGGALLGRKKYTEAEPLLLKGYQGMKAREKTIPPQGSTRIPEALDRLIDLYTATNKPDEVANWQAERAKYPFLAPMPRQKKQPTQSAIPQGRICEV